MTVDTKAFEIMDEIVERSKTSGLAMFLDYDGTLTPIVPRPEDAILTDSMRETVKRLSEKCTLGVVSGRELQDVKNLVKLDDIVYAGDHGFNIDAPGAEGGAYRPAEKFLPAVKKAAADLNSALEGVPGAWVEEKTFTLSIHYRQTPEERAGEVEKLVEKKAAELDLRLTSGKKVYEFRPNIEWHKGKAVEWLREKLGVTDAFTIYIGDDTTDEDAFKALGDDGLGILVADEPKETAARAILDTPDDVERFLSQLAEKL
jgi:alpha,alpha-trehalase